MNDTFFGSLHPYYEKGHINGRTMANAGFMTALLRRDPFAEYHFFVAQPDSLATLLKTPPLAALPAVQRGAVRTFQRTALPQSLRHNPYAVFHFSDPVSEYSALCQARNAWAPQIFPITAVNHSISYTHYNSAFLQHIWSGVSPRDAIGCNSSAAKLVIEKYFRLLQCNYASPACQRVPLLRVIPMGVEPPALLPDNPQGAAPRASMRKKLEASTGSILCLVFGRISLTDKLDPTPLMLALRRARQDCPTLDIRLIMAGFARLGDNTAEYLRAVAKILDIPFCLLPNPTDEEKNALFAAADIFVSPSDNVQETFGLSLLEAGAAHLPTIASDWDGYRDIIIPQRTGLLVPTMAPADTPELDLLSPLLFDNQHHVLRSQQSAVSVPELAAALCLLAADAPLRERMGQQAHAHVLEHFTWDAVVSRWLNLWQELRDTPLSPAAHEQLRHTRHPTHLPTGALFAPYASHSLCPDTRVRCTALGETLRRGSIPFQAFTTFDNMPSPEEIMPLLVWARAGTSLAQLHSRSPNMPPEKLNYYILWALKHDLLEQE
ncbi:MAG: glycosyltransferase family 4 protein [Desulfovibrionaceae bacterium]